MARIFGTELRVATGRFCQHNCFQEALLPILEHQFGCSHEPFSVLRMLDWGDVIAAIEAGHTPGIVGGLQPDQMAELYDIRWALGAGEPEKLVSQLAECGPPIVKVDRFYVPTDVRWHGRAHRPHTILVVEIDGDGVHYSDADYPFEPAFVDWRSLGRALLRAPDGELAFARSVATCGGLTDDRRAIIEHEFRDKLAAALLAPPELVASTLNYALLEIARLDRDDLDTRGVDLVSFSNALAKSFSAGWALLSATEGKAGDAVDYLGEVARHLDLCVSRALAYVQTGRPRHAERTAEAVERFDTVWRSRRRFAAAEVTAAA